jgi:hypothetical protein
MDKKQKRHKYFRPRAISITYSIRSLVARWLTLWPSEDSISQSLYACQMALSPSSTESRRRGHYGSFLMEEWDLIASMVSLLHKELKVPVTAKIRVFDDVEKTIRCVLTAGHESAYMHLDLCAPCVCVCVCVCGFVNASPRWPSPKPMIFDDVFWFGSSVS